MIYVCAVKACHQLFSSSSADLLSDPCPSCYRDGWRTDEIGNTYQHDTAPQARRVMFDDVQ